MSKIILFDRDGTLIVDPPDLRVDRLEKVRLFPDCIPAMHKLAKHGYDIIMITNQAGIAEGRLSAEEFTEINNTVVSLIQASGIKVLQTYMCPHGPKDNCDCKKPKPKLLIDALRDYGKNPAETYMVGDRQSDISAGISAGIKAILVETGNSPVTSPDATKTCKNLTEVVDYILKNP